MSPAATFIPVRGSVPLASAAGAPSRAPPEEAVVEPGFPDEDELDVSELVAVGDGELGLADDGALGDDEPLEGLVFVVPEAAAGVLAVVGASTTIVPCMNGWIWQ